MRRRSIAALLLMLSVYPLWAATANLNSVVLPDSHDAEVVQSTFTTSVQSVDTVLGKLVVFDGNGNPLSLTIDDTTPLRDRQGLQIRLADLKRGQSVTVVYQQYPLTVKQITQN